MGSFIQRVCALALCVGAACGGRPPPTRDEPAPAQPAQPAQPTQVMHARGWNDTQPMTVAVYFDDARTRGFVTVGEDARRWTSKVFPMWKAALADIDADGRDELVLGVWSRTKRHDEPEPHRAVWVLDWNGAGLDETWRGSALARPLLDFDLADLDGDSTVELVSLERAAPEAGCYHSAYRWNGFGFAGVAKLAVSCEPSRPLRAATLENGKLTPK